MPDRALTAILSVLRCPLCVARLSLVSRSLRCARGHCFDIARQGYVNLYSGHRRTATADTSPMVAARDAFLSAGHYAPIASTLASLGARLNPAAGPGVAVDLAGGTGYYLGAFLGSVTARAGICLDLSKPALRRAVRTHPRVAAVGADVWRRLPLANGSAAIVLSVFGPRNTEEIRRVLARDGILLLVTPTAQHLHEVISDLGMLTVDAAKPQRLAASLAELDLAFEQTLTYRVALHHPDLSNLVAMGPSARHIPTADLAHRVAALPQPLLVTVSVRVAAYRG
ncbi:MAG: putative RNA methyltransferase [Pseudonocardiaceae bacterium]